MATQGGSCGRKATFIDFYPEGTSNEALAEFWGNETWFSSFFKDQKGVNGKLKYWNFRCVHFPAIDEYLNKQLEAAFNLAKSAKDKAKVAEQHPVNELLWEKHGGGEMVWPIWVISTKEISIPDIIHACASIIYTHQDTPQYGPGTIDPMDRELSAWCELDACEPLHLLGLMTEGDKHTPPALTRNGEKFLDRFLSKGQRRKTEVPESLFLLAGSPVLELGSLCTYCTPDVYEIINFYLIDCLKETDLNQYGEAVASLTVVPPPAGTKHTFDTPTTLKNYRLNWEQVRALEETADFLNINPISVIKSLITKHCGDLVLGDIKETLQAQGTALRSKEARFNLWKNALNGFQNRGFFIPKNLEDVSDVAKAKADKARNDREELFAEEITESVAKIQSDLQKLIDAKKNKAETIDGGFYGEKPGGSVILTSKDGFNARRVIDIEYQHWKAVQERVEKVIQSSYFAGKPFLFRGLHPTVIRAGQIKHTNKAGADRSLFADDFAGYVIKAEKKEKVVDIINEFNKALHENQNYPKEPNIIWPSVTLTKEWVDFGNNLPLDELSPGQTYYIPDPRSLPDGDPPASQYPMTTD